MNAWSLPYTASLFLWTFSSIFLPLSLFIHRLTLVILSLFSKNIHPGVHLLVCVPACSLIALAGKSLTSMKLFCCLRGDCWSVFYSCLSSFNRLHLKLFFCLVFLCREQMGMQVWRGHQDLKGLR